MPVNAVGLHHDSERVILDWADGHRSEFHALWLFDNRPEHRHPRNGQRLVDVSDLPADVVIMRARLGPDALEIEWADGTASTIALQWLRENCCCSGHGRRQPVRLWDASEEEVLRRVPYRRVVEDASVRLAWLRSIAESGLGFLSGVPASSGTVLEVARLLGWVRETNYGRVFEVRWIPDPANLADSALALGLHTDNPYREPVPGLQLLHCLRAGPVGGDSVFADGFSVVEALRESDRDAVTVLETTPVRFRYSDTTCYLEAERPIIEAAGDGRVQAVNYNNRSIAPVLLPVDRIPTFYAAYRAFARLLKDTRLTITTRLAEGDLVVFNNRRVLHGRTGFEPTAERRLEGCYLDCDGLFSNVAVMERLVEGSGQH